MRKYLPGLIAIGLAIGTIAFTKAPEAKRNHGATAFADPCSDAVKQWYMISLDCSSQVTLADIRNPLNYSKVTELEVTNQCNGDACVCAIWACPATGNTTLPNISSNTSIYTELNSFYRFGTSSVYISTKDQSGLTERRR